MSVGNIYLYLASDVLREYCRFSIVVVLILEALQKRSGTCFSFQRGMT